MGINFSSTSNAPVTNHRPELNNHIENTENPSTFTKSVALGGFIANAIGAPLPQVAKDGYIQQINAVESGQQSNAAGNFNSIGHWLKVGGLTGAAGAFGNAAAMNLSVVQDIIESKAGGMFKK